MICHSIFKFGFDQGVRRGEVCLVEMLENYIDLLRTAVVGRMQDLIAFAVMPFLWPLLVSVGLQGVHLDISLRSRVLLVVLLLLLGPIDPTSVLLLLPIHLLILRCLWGNISLNCLLIT